MTAQISDSFKACFDRSQDIVDFQEQYKFWRAGKQEHPADEQIREIMIRSFARIYKV